MNGFISLYVHPFHVSTLAPPKPYFHLIHQPTNQNTTMIGNSIFSAEEEQQEEEEDLDPYNKRKRLWEQGC